MFPIDYKLDLQLNYCHNHSRGIKIEAILECQESLYTIRFKVDSTVSNLISSNSRDLISTKVNKIFRIYKAFMDGHEIKLKWNDAKIIHAKSIWQQCNDYTEYYYTIDSFEIVKGDEGFKPARYTWFLAKNSLIRKDLKLIASEENPNTNVFDITKYSFLNEEYGLCHDIELSYSYLMSENNDKDKVNKFLKCISFYYGYEIRPWLQISKRTNGTSYCYRKVNAIPEKAVQPQIWKYYMNDSEVINIAKLISAFNEIEKIKEEEKLSVIYKSVRLFTLALSRSGVQKFTDLCTIIMSISQFLHNPANKQDIELFKFIFKEVGIDMNKVNAGISDKGLKRTGKTDKDRNLNNVVDLRNEITHGLTSDDIIDFLDESFMVSLLENATFIIILHELGFNHLKYTWLFDVFNVLASDKSK